jgi:hypothetical protein
MFKKKESVDQTPIPGCEAKSDCMKNVCFLSDGIMHIDIKDNLIKVFPSAKLYVIFVFCGQTKTVFT